MAGRKGRPIGSGNKTFKELWQDRFIEMQRLESAGVTLKQFSSYFGISHVTGRKLSRAFGIKLVPGKRGYQAIQESVPLETGGFLIGSTDKLMPGGAPKPSGRYIN